MEEKTDGRNDTADIIAWNSRAAMQGKAEGRLIFRDVTDSDEVEQSIALNLCNRESVN